MKIFFILIFYSVTIFGFEGIEVQDFSTSDNTGLSNRERVTRSEEQVIQLTSYLRLFNRHLVEFSNKLKQMESDSDILAQLKDDVEQLQSEFEQLSERIEQGGQGVFEREVVEQMIDEALEQRFDQMLEVRMNAIERSLEALQQGIKDIQQVRPPIR